jgi:hypothetical protein
MICIAIPTVVRPLWRKLGGGSAASAERYYKHAQGTDVVNSDALHMGKVADDDGGQLELDEDGIAGHNDAGILRTWAQLVGG